MHRGAAGGSTIWTFSRGNKVTGHDSPDVLHSEAVQPPTSCPRNPQPHLLVLPAAPAAAQLLYQPLARPLVLPAACGVALVLPGACGVALVLPGNPPHALPSRQLAIAGEGVLQLDQLTPLSLKHRSDVPTQATLPKGSAGLRGWCPYLRAKSTFFTLGNLFSLSCILNLQDKSNTIL
jgi:hypothetical protein